MKIGIVGIGAMGSLFAHHLVRGGAEVWAWDGWVEHVKAINSRGLLVEREGLSEAFRINATCDAKEIGECDAVLVMVKYSQTQAAMRSASAMIGNKTKIITLQNGIGNVESIAEIYPERPIIYGFTTLTCELVSAGKIVPSYINRGETYLWPTDGVVDPLLEQFCRHLTSGGIDARAADDIEVRIWKKLVVNCCLNAVCAIADLPVGKLIDQPSSWSLLYTTADEIAAVARAKGLDLDDSVARGFLRQVAQEARSHEPSMLIDIRSRRKTEIDCLNGAVLQQARRMGVPAPSNEVLYSLIRVLEGRFSS